MDAPQKKIIAAFDFDGTITTKDTLFDFIAFYHGKVKLLLGLVILSPVLVLYLLKIVKNSTAKQSMFAYFFKGEPISVFERKCQVYADRIAEISRPEVLELLQEHQSRGEQVVIVSASIDRWIVPWATRMNIETVIGTTVRVENGCVERHFLSANCYGQEKVSRLLELFPNRKDYVLYAYGDSSGDNELLAFADFGKRV
ncbi:MAG: haloacid dehalogenase-like hydrolase [Prevotella sp.]|jgi:HAD superfamily hydrolase (TIGR01490 family)|nr:haloacid dehalogenase-like hydrolase [Prevotella sp.]